MRIVTHRENKLIKSHEAVLFIESDGFDISFPYVQPDIGFVLTLGDV